MTAASLNTGAIVQRDHAKWAKKLKPNTPELLVYAARQSGRNPVAIGVEATRLKRGKAHIQMDEYVKFGLYDNPRFTAEERACRSFANAS